LRSLGQHRGPEIGDAVPTASEVFGSMVAVSEVMNSLSQRRLCFGEDHRFAILLTYTNFILAQFWHFVVLYVFFESYYWYYGFVGGETETVVVGLVHQLIPSYFLIFLGLHGCRLDLILRCICHRCPQRWCMWSESVSRWCLGRCCFFYPLLILEKVAPQEERLTPIVVVVIGWAQQRTLNLVLIWVCILLLYFRFSAGGDHISPRQEIEPKEVVSSPQNTGQVTVTVYGKSVCETQNGNISGSGPLAQHTEISSIPSPEVSIAHSCTKTESFLVLTPIFASAVFTLKLGNGSLNIIHGSGSNILASVLAVLTVACRCLGSGIVQTKTVAKECETRGEVVWSPHQNLVSQSMAMMLAANTSLLLYISNPLFVIRFASAYLRNMHLPVQLRMLHFVALVAPSFVLHTNTICHGMCLENGCFKSMFKAPLKRRRGFCITPLFVLASLIFLLRIKSVWWQLSCPDWLGSIVGILFTAGVSWMATEVVRFVRHTLALESIHPLFLEVRLCPTNGQKPCAVATIDRYVLRKLHVCRAFMLVYLIWVFQSAPMLELQTALLLIFALLCVYFVWLRGDGSKTQHTTEHAVVGPMQVRYNLQEAKLAISSLCVFILALHIPQWALYDLTFETPRSLDVPGHDTNLGVGVGFNITVVTWNIQRGFAGTDMSTAVNYGNVYAYLGEMGADIAAFQEVEAGHPFTGASDFGSFLGSASSSGLCARPSRFGSSSGCDFYYGAVLAEQRLFANTMLSGSGVRLRDCSVGKWENRFPNPMNIYTLCAAEAGSRHIAIYNVHPGRPAFVATMPAIAEMVRASIKSNAFDGVVVMGDFNGRISEQKATYQILVDLGMVNVLNPLKLANYTYPGTRMRVPTIPLIDVDHIYVFGHKRVVQARAREDLWADELSDHIPVVATLEF